MTEEEAHEHGQRDGLNATPMGDFVQYNWPGSSKIARAYHKGYENGRSQRAEHRAAERRNEADERRREAEDRRRQEEASRSSTSPSDRRNRRSDYSDPPPETEQTSYELDPPPEDDDYNDAGDDYREEHSDSSADEEEVDESERYVQPDGQDPAMEAKLEDLGYLDKVEYDTVQRKYILRAWEVNITGGTRFTRYGNGVVEKFPKNLSTDDLVKHFMNRRKVDRLLGSPNVIHTVNIDVPPSLAGLAEVLAPWLCR